MTETLILVPGLNCTGRLFERQVEAFSRTRPVLVADTTQDDSLPGMARRLLANAPDRFALAGLSMGGYVALEVIRQAPGRVAALALLDTSARPESEAARADRERLIAMAACGRFEEVHPILWPRLVAEARLQDRTLEAIVLSMMRAIGPGAFMRQERAIMARPDSRPDLPSIEIPTLVLVGEEDRLTPPELAREMAEMIEWASLVIIPEAGHLSTLERPDAVVEAMAAWLDRAGTP
jgi:pimeloyl-ACP methyl ester carboxylesterase